MTTSLLLRLAGPQQSWGSVGSPSYRTTELAPTRTGIEGLLNAALGVPRGECAPLVADLDILVRIDRPGRVEWDFHTVTPVPDDVAEARGRWALLAGHRRDDKPIDWMVPRGTTKWELTKGETPTMLSRRAYLADAEFIVAISGPDEHIEHLHAALRQPVFSPYLGRRAFAPAFPFILGTRPTDPSVALAEHPTEAEGRLRVLRIDGDRGTYVTSVQPNAA